MSPSTISRALAGNSRISAETIELVRSTADRLNYRPNRLASSLRKGTTQLIGIIVPRINRAFFASAIRAVQSVAGRSGYSVIVTESEDDPLAEARSLQALLRAQVDGVIASIGQNTTDFSTFQEVLTRGTPLVFFDRVTDQLSAATVRIDDEQGARLATRHLIEQGCRYPVHLAGPQQLNIYSGRLAGFRSAIQEAGLPYNPHRQIVMVEHEAAGGRRAMEHLLARNDPPDGIFSASDWAATGALQVLRERGVAVPDDIAVIGFADETFTAFLEPPLSSVQQHSQKLGEAAARVLLDLLKTSGGSVPDAVVLQPDLVIRASSLRTERNGLPNKNLL